MEILISGAGIAGSTLAWWLVRGGHRVVLVETAPTLRTGGYIIDFWGKGYDLAERMGLKAQVEQAGYHVREVRFVDETGHLAGGFGTDVFGRMTGGRFVSLPRGELARLLFEAVRNDVETRFGDSITGLTQDAGGVEVTFEHAAPRRFDMVVGAEGIHSVTRELAFGPEERFERFLGYGFAAFILDGYPRRDPDVYVMYGEPGRQAARFTQRDGSSLVLLIWRDADKTALPHEPAAERALLRARYAGAGWEVPAMLAALDQARDLYLDRVSQIRLDRWHEGRIGLVGDAAFAPSFLAGQGSALAMIGAYVLAGELASSGGDVRAALAAYSDRLMTFMRGKQDAAMGMAAMFVPATRLGLFVRRIGAKFLRIPWLADRLIGRGIRDPIDLPDYS